jgi:hypothetical protein
MPAVCMSFYSGWNPEAAVTRSGAETVGTPGKVSYGFSAGHRVKNRWRIFSKKT